MMHTIHAPSRHHLLPLIEVRKALEGPYTLVEVRFDDGAPPYTYSRADLPLIYRKITYSM